MKKNHVNLVKLFGNGGVLGYFNTIQAQVSMKINQIWLVSPASHEFMTMKEESCFATTCSLHPQETCHYRIYLPIRLIISSLTANVVHMYQTHRRIFVSIYPILVYMAATCKIN